MICGLSGGVDSAVAAALVQRAIGDQLTCVFVDHGLLRAGEAEQVERDFVAATGVKLKVIDARAQFLDALDGVTDPEDKRKIIGREFIRAFEQAAREIVAAGGSVEFLVQGTLYPDVVESGGGTGTANIKSHHNVGGLPDDLAVRARRAAADPVQGRGAPRRRATRPAVRDRVAAAVPRPGSRHPHRRRGDRRAPGHPAPRRCDRPGRTVRRRAGSRHLAVPGCVARRRAVGRCAGRRAQLRPSRSCCGRCRARTR